MQSENAQLQREHARLNEAVNEWMSAAKRAQEQAEYHKTHKEVVEREVEVEVESQKCEDCLKDKYRDKLHELERKKSRIRIEDNFKKAFMNTSWAYLALFSAVTTVSQIFIHSIMKADGIAFFGALKSIFLFVWEFLKKQFIAVCGEGFVSLVVTGCVMIILIALICALAGKLIKRLDADDIWNSTQLVVLLVSTALIVNLDVYIKSIFRINLYLFWLIVQICTIIIREIAYKKTGL